MADEPVEDDDHPGGCVLVPVNGVEVAAVRLARRPNGRRVGLAFTTTQRLVAAMGPQQRWIVIDEAACLPNPAPRVGVPAESWSAAERFSGGDLGGYFATGSRLNSRFAQR